MRTKFQITALFMSFLNSCAPEPDFASLTETELFEAGFADEADSSQTDLMTTHLDLGLGGGWTEIVDAEGNERGGVHMIGGDDVWPTFGLLNFDEEPYDASIYYWAKDGRFNIMVYDGASFRVSDTEDIERVQDLVFAAIRLMRNAGFDAPQRD